MLKTAKNTAKAAKQTVKTAKWKTNTAKAEVRLQNEMGLCKLQFEPLSGQ